MFWKKKVKVDNCKTHPSLGEMKYLGVGWKLTEKVKMTLWNKAYDVPVCLVTSSVEEDVNEKQADSMEKLRSVIAEQKSKIEEVIMQYLKSDDEEDSCRRFVHEDIYISQNGECALFARDADEEEYDDLGSGFAMFLVPKIMLYSPEDCLDFVLGHWSAFTEEDLYSESGHKREGE